MLPAAQYDAILVEPNRADPKNPFEYPVEIHGYDINGEVVAALEPADLSDKSRFENIRVNAPDKLGWPVAVPHMAEVKNLKGRVNHSGTIPFEVTGRSKSNHLDGKRVTIKNCYAMTFAPITEKMDFNDPRAKIRRFFNVEIHYHGKRTSPVRKGYKHGVSIEDDMPSGGSIVDSPFIRPFNDEAEKAKWNALHPGDGINRPAPVQMTNDDADKKAAAEEAAKKAAGKK